MVIAHFINKGHTLEEMCNLSASEMLFYSLAWEIEAEGIAESVEKAVKN